MSSAIYKRLARTNLKNNQKTYRPYLLTSAMMVMLFYMIAALAGSEDLGNGQAGTCLELTVGIVAVFAVIFLFYTNSFLIKRRKKELGVYQVLGMEKRHLAKMMAEESLIVAGISIVSGLFLGIVLEKMMYLILLKILKGTANLKFSVSIRSVEETALLFAAIFLLTFLYNLIQVKQANPMELLRGGNQGEKEPKTRWFLALVGVVALACGYAIALTTKEPMQALSKFFLAVLLVIIGTYALFTAGSIAALKMLKKNKTYYYKSNHFTTVSGMIYRMKQNAAGLANICILSTMVLIIISSTVSLYGGMEDILTIRFPQEVTVTDYQANKEKDEQMEQILKAACRKYRVKREDQLTYQGTSTFAILDGKKADYINVIEYSRGNFVSVNLISLEDYNRMEETKETLEENQVLVYLTKGSYKEHTLEIGGKSFRVKRELDHMKLEPKNENSMTRELYLIVPTKEQIQEVTASAPNLREGAGDSLYTRICFSPKGEKTNVRKALEQVQSEIGALETVEIESRELSRDSFYNLYGSLFFIGIYLGVTFLIATVLIIYYKQISEGYDDRERFQIMQKVGMSKAEVRHTIKSQVLNVFFLPLVMAIIHVTVAFQVVTKLLALLNLTNVHLFMRCTIATILVFAVFYGIIYMWTAREYYQIVKD